jgi:hypothetical protein
LVVGRRLATEARKHIPGWWGLKIASEDSANTTTLIDQRAPKMNPHIDPIALAELLWRSEVVELLSCMGATPKLLRSPRAVLYRELMSSMPIDQLRETVRARLKMRKGWRDHKQPLSDAYLSQPTPMY